MTEVNENLWELVYSHESLGFHLEDDAATGYQLREAVKALCAPYQPVYELLRERGDEPAPFAALLDPDRIPAQWLDFLAQMVGVIPTPEMDEAHLRAEIKQPTGWRRGEAASIKLAAQKTLTGTKRVILRARTPEVGHHFIRTLASETPDEERTRKVLRENAAFGTLTTPDEIKEVVVPTNALLLIGSSFGLKSSVSGAGRAAIFIGANQLKGAAGGANPVVQEVATTAAGSLQHVTTYPGGLSIQTFAIWGADVTTGQTLGDVAAAAVPVLGGFAVIFVAAGTYNITLQFKATSGNVTAKERKLWACVLGS